MRPIPIPDHLEVPGRTRRVVIGPPDGDPTGDIRPVEALVGIVDDQPRICVLLQLEDGDLERLKETPAVWLTMLTPQIPAFMVHIADDQDYVSAGMAACDLCSNPVPMGEAWEVDVLRDAEPVRTRGHRECIDAAS